MANEQQNNQRAAQRAALKSLLFEQKKSINEQDAFLNEAREGWQELGQDKFEKISERIDNKIDEKSVPPKERDKIVLLNSFFFRTISIAATILIAVISIWLVNSKQSNPQNLYASYYKPLHDDNAAVIRGEEDRVESNAFKAAQAYEAEEFDQAIYHYKELLNSQPGNAKYTLFLGLAFMSSGKPEAAIHLYNDFKPTGENYDEDIQWYLALAYLQKGEVRTSKVLIKDLSTSKSYYANTASELLKKID